MKVSNIVTATLAVLSVPAFLLALPNQIGGFGNNIMEEEKWERPPNYEEWRMDGQGQDGRAPGAADPKPKAWVNSKPVNVYGLAAPEGAAQLKTKDGKWQSVRVRLPGRKSDDFHLLMSNLKIETGKDFAVDGKRGERVVAAALDKVNVNIKELPSGELDVFITRKLETTVSAR